VLCGESDLMTISIFPRHPLLRLRTPRRRLRRGRLLLLHPFRRLPPCSPASSQAARRLHPFRVRAS